MAETILIPPGEWQVIRIDEYKRLTTEYSELKRSYHERVRDEINRIRDEFRVKSVCEDRDGVYYQLHIIAADRTPDGVMVVVSASGNQT